MILGGILHPSQNVIINLIFCLLEGIGIHGSKRFRGWNDLIFGSGILIATMRISSGRKLTHGSRLNGDLGILYIRDGVWVGKSILAWQTINKVEEVIL